MSPFLLWLYKRVLRSPNEPVRRLRPLVERLLGRRLYQVPYLDGAVWVRPAQNIGQHVLLAGHYEGHLVDVVQAYTRAGFSFVDVGANIGLHVLAASMARRDETQRFLAFEPESDVFSQLAANCALNGLDFITLRQEGIGDQPGELLLHTSTDFNEGSHSLLPRPGTAAAGRVPITTLDSALPELLPTGGAVLLKIDIEGFEPQALAGGQTWLTAQKTAALLMEVSPVLLRDSGRSELLLVEWLRRLGYTDWLIINDSDTFLPGGLLLNDYFNILAWKGQQAADVGAALPASHRITHVPPNAADFVDWQQFSTAPLARR